MSEAAQPRIYPEDIERLISAEFYFTAENGVEGAELRHRTGYAPPHCLRHDGQQVCDRLAVLTFCVLVLRNGFTVTGESACASTGNFDPELGRKYAREAAVNKVWPLVGYELRSRLADKP